MKITISGELGGGKTVLGKLLCEKLQCKMISVGGIQRELAEKYGMTTIEFNKYMETHPEIDHECDNKVVEYGKSDANLILDSRLAWHFVPHAFKIHLIININIAGERIFNDSVRKNEQNKDLQDTINNIRIRKASECKRFMEQYKLDIDRLANYDIVVDSSFITPEELANFVIAKFHQKEAGVLKPQVWLSPKNAFPLKNIENLNSDSVTESVQKVGFNEEEPIEVIKWENNFFIYNGHKRCWAALVSGMKLMPVKVINVDTNILPDGQSVQTYIEKNYIPEYIASWEKVNDFRFVSYFK